MSIKKYSVQDLKFENIIIGKQMRLKGLRVSIMVKNKYIRTK